MHASRPTPFRSGWSAFSISVREYWNRLVRRSAQSSSVCLAAMSSRATHLDQGRSRGRGLAPHGLPVVSAARSEAGCARGCCVRGGARPPPSVELQARHIRGRPSCRGPSLTLVDASVRRSSLCSVLHFSLTSDEQGGDLGNGNTASLRTATDRAQSPGAVVGHAAPTWRRALVLCTNGLTGATAANCESEHSPVLLAAKCYRLQTTLGLPSGRLGLASGPGRAVQLGLTAPVPVHAPGPAT